MISNLFKPVALALASFLTVLAASTPTPALLILSKRDHTMAIVDPQTLAIVAKLPSGNDPHEVIASSDGRFAYISNYGGGGVNSLHTITVNDLVEQRALPAIDLAPLHGAHGLAFARGKLYFTAEANKIIGRYDPASQKVDWELGTGQDRTHMVVVSEDGKRIFTSNVNSGTISIFEQRANAGPQGPPPGMPQPSGPPPGPGGRGPGPGPGTGMDWHEDAVQVGAGPEGFDVSPDGQEVWSANSHDGSLSVISVASRKVIQTIDAHVNFSNRLKFTLDGKYVFVSSLGNGDLAIFDTGTRKEVKRLKVGRGAAGILMEPNGARVFVACSPNDTVAVIDLKTLEVVAHIDAGGEPDGLAWATR